MTSTTRTIRIHQAVATGGSVSDRLGRPLTDLRISLTDRCNFRCSYCMPKSAFGPGHAFLPKGALLTPDEIERAAEAFMGLGVRKIRLTGGEPLLRDGVEGIVARLAGLGAELAMTTNGALLSKKARALGAAGLGRATVSLDALDNDIFMAMNDVGFPVFEVLGGIEAAQAAGLGPVKINMVVKRGTNDGQILPMARRFAGSGASLRFIEYMDVGATNGWKMNQVVPSSEVLDILRSEFNLARLHRGPGDTSERWGVAGSNGIHDPALGEFGFVSSVSGAFCSDCSRARLSADGKVHLCLFGGPVLDLRALMRSGASDTELVQAIGEAWRSRSDRYSEGRQPEGEGRSDGRPEMSYIGG